MIDWSNPEAMISVHFKVKEALWLPSWQIYHIPSDEEKAAIVATALKMDIVREFLEKPINVHCFIRPTAVNCPTSGYNGRNYNSAVGGAPHSSHVLGRAVDFNPTSMVCDEARTLLLPKLVELDMRMERRDGSNWVHLDTMPVPPGGNRYFLP